MYNNVIDKPGKPQKQDSYISSQCEACFAESPKRLPRRRSRTDSFFSGFSFCAAWQQALPVVVELSAMLLREHLHSLVTLEDSKQDIHNIHTLAANRLSWTLNASLLQLSTVTRFFPAVTQNTKPKECGGWFFHGTGGNPNESQAQTLIQWVNLFPGVSAEPLLPLNDQPKKKGTLTRKIKVDLFALLKSLGNNYTFWK